MLNNLLLLIHEQKLRKFYDEECECITDKFGLHRIDAEILLFISNHKDICAKDIVSKTHFSKSHISNVIENLTEKGYVNCITDANDKRRIILYTTDASKDIVTELASFYSKIMSILSKGISPEEIAILYKVLNKISQNINEELFVNKQINKGE